MQSRIEDWIEFLIPGCSKGWIKEMDPSKVPSKKESRLDKLILIDSPKERFILNIEPQGYLDYAMSARMLRYRADIWEHTISTGIGMPSIRQVVIYFYKQHDNKEYLLEDSWDGIKTLEFKYKSIKVWELKKASIIERKLEGLYPLLPLMEREYEETDEQIMDITIQTIKMVENIGLQADLIAVVSILAAQVFNSELVRKYIRRDMLMDSPIYNEWVEEERKEAAQEAELQTTKRNIIELLVEKFDFIPKVMRENIENINDILILHDLFRKSIKVSTIEEFQEILDKAIKINKNI